MKHAIPKCILETMKEEIIYGALKEAIKELTGSDYQLPPEYNQAIEQGGSPGFAEQIDGLHHSLQEDIVEISLTLAHDHWRGSTEALRLINSEECCNHLNAFTELALAGPDIFLVWSRMFERIFQASGFDFETTYQNSTTPSKAEFTSQISWMSDVDCFARPMFKDIFVRMRRRLVESTSIVGKRDLYEYVTEQKNDVLGLAPLPEDTQKQLSLKAYVRHLLYYDNPETNIAFRLTRQIILANGGGSPIDW